MCAGGRSVVRPELSFDVRDGTTAFAHGDGQWYVAERGRADDREQSPWWRDALLRRMLAAADAGAGILVGLCLAIGTDELPRLYWLAALLPAWIVLAKLHGLYDRDHRVLRALTVDELPRICLWGLTGTTGTTILIVAADSRSVPASRIVAAWIVACGSALMLRSVARSLWRRLTPPERTLIVGKGPLADATKRKLHLFPDIHVQLVEETIPPEAPERLESVRGRIDRLILASHTIDEGLVADLLAYCRRERVKLSIVPPVRAMFGTAVQLDNVADLPFLQYNTWDVSRSTLLLKRALDICLSLIALVVVAPVGVVIALAIRIDTRGPVIFAQSRAGHLGRPFRMFKFRTMVPNAEKVLPGLVRFDELDEPVFKLRDDPRVTRVGRLLRRTSLDELPQLVNVLRGDMSLVGPRPEQVELVDLYGVEERVRLAVRPGMTGPMQVSGRGELTLEERLAVEREYIENLTLGRDLRILAMTMPAVLGARGAF
jgi:exopolysaccharide biosynthesis polyprenyl glycosylphosphotransferase